MRSLLLALSSFAWITVSASAQTDDAPIVGICEVVSDPAAFHGQRVVLMGRLRSDFHHFSVIIDESCPESGVLLGGRERDVGRGRQEFFEAWYAARACPEDPLYFTVVGRIDLSDWQGIWRWNIIVETFDDIRRDPGSDCPMTLQELYEPTDRQAESSE